MSLVLGLKVAALIVFASVALLFGYAVYQDFGNHECGLTEAQAHAMVLKDLTRRGLPVSDLSSAKATGTCQYDYEYSGGEARLDYVVMSTWGHGVKISWYDHAQHPGQKP